MGDNICKSYVCLEVNMNSEYMNNTTLSNKQQTTLKMSIQKWTKGTARWPWRPRGPPAQDDAEGGAGGRVVGGTGRGRRGGSGGGAAAGVKWRISGS